MRRPFCAVWIALLACYLPAWPQRPSDTDSAALIEKSRQKALQYTQSLPDFVCTQVIHRYAAPTDGRSHQGWRQIDTLTLKLSYFQQKEDHQLALINGRPTERQYDDVGGTISSGEFGSILRVIFEPTSQAAFEWQSWKNDRKHRVAVYEYAVSAASSPYTLRNELPCACATPIRRHATVGIHGVVEVDVETAEVWRLTYAAYDIPKQLEMQSATTTVEYDLADVGGRSYLLPARSEAELRSTDRWTRNKMEFRDYRKFSADSVVDFGTGK
jgi:hypothetical protein